MSNIRSRTNIIFDADDTLWKTEELYDRAREKFVKYIDSLGLGPEDLVWEIALKIDLQNFDKYHLSPTRFPKSLVETYEQRCKTLHKEADDSVKQQVEAIGNEVFQQKADSIPGVEETLKELKEAGCRLYLWTHGDETVQKRRIDQSGLRTYFRDEAGIEYIIIDEEKNDRKARTIDKKP